LKRSFVFFAAAFLLSAMSCARTQADGVVWKAGDPVLGRWIVANTYQCGAPVQTGARFTFNLVLNGQSCGRNQMLPLTADGDRFDLTPGRTYTWTFNYIDGTPSGGGPGMGPDADARSLIWQLHTGHGYKYGNCMQLGFWNGGSPGTAQKWYFYGTCSGDSAPFAMPYAPQETDAFKIVAYISDTSSGYTTLYRNGTLVGTITGPNFNDDPGSGPWWNFGPYKWRWELANGGGSSMTAVNVTIDDMTLIESPR
jgi:hypothetical protein